MRAAWPIYSKRHSSVLDEEDVPPCKSVMFDVSSQSGAVGGGDLKRGYGMDAGESVSESSITSGGF